MDIGEYLCKVPKSGIGCRYSPAYLRLLLAASTMELLKGTSDWAMMWRHCTFSPFRAIHSFMDAFSPPSSSLSAKLFLLFKIILFIITFCLRSSAIDGTEEAKL